MPKSLNPSEHDIQAALVEYLNLLDKLVHSIPNEGQRSPRTGKRMKDRGLLPGVLDLFLAEAERGYHGFYLEVKEPGKKPSPLQYVFMHKARANGYYANWCDNVDDGLRMINWYFNIRPNF